MRQARRHFETDIALVAVGGVPQRAKQIAGRQDIGQNHSFEADLRIGFEGLCRGDGRRVSRVLAQRLLKDRRV